MIDLAIIHTKILLKMLASTRSFSEYEWDCMSKEERQAHFDYKESLKTELKSRPHIPNKAEGKKLRQEAAKRKT